MIVSKHLSTAFIVGLFVGFVVGAGISMRIHRGVLETANSRGDVCVQQLASYQADTKAEIHTQMQTLSKKYLVLNQDVFIDVLNAAAVDLEKEYHNLYTGEIPLDK